MVNREKNKIAIIFYFIGLVSFGYFIVFGLPDTRRKIGEIEWYVSVANKVQKTNIQDYCEFSKTFDELNIGGLSGGDTGVLNNIQYKIDIKPDLLAVTGSKSLKKDKYSFVGLVKGQKISQGLFVATSILCRSSQCPDYRWLW
jgi:hypothetical protein